MKADVLADLKRVRHNLTLQEYRTLKGQVRAGDVDGASRGLVRILTRKFSRG